MPIESLDIRTAIAPYRPTWPDELAKPERWFFWTDPVSLCWVIGLLWQWEGENHYRCIEVERVYFLRGWDKFVSVIKDAGMEMEFINQPGGAAGFLNMRAPALGENNSMFGNRSTTYTKPPKPLAVMPIPECHPGKPYGAIGLCQMCYQRQRRLRMKRRGAYG